MIFIAKALVTILSFSLLDSSFGLRARRRRDVDDLAPEVNKNHPQVYRRNANDLSKYTVCFYEDTPLHEISEFQNEFEEFIVKRLPNFDLVHVEIPTALSEDVILDIRAETFVEVVENVLTLSSHDIHWNKARVGAINFYDIGSGDQEFYGRGFGAYIYVIDSGIDDHLGNKLKIYCFY
eukprot:Awhi_evm1s15304